MVEQESETLFFIGWRRKDLRLKAKHCWLLDADTVTDSRFPSKKVKLHPSLPAQ